MIMEKVFLFNLIVRAFIVAQDAQAPVVTIELDSFHVIRSENAIELRCKRRQSFFISQLSPSYARSHALSSFSRLLLRIAIPPSDQNELRATDIRFHG